MDDTVLAPMTPLGGYVPIVARPPDTLGDLAIVAPLCDRLADDAGTLLAARRALLAARGVALTGSLGHALVDAVLAADGASLATSGYMRRLHALTRAVDRLAGEGR